MQIRDKSEQTALRWLCNTKKLSPATVVHTRGGGKPNFIIRYDTGYEVKSLDKYSKIVFERRKYDSLRLKWKGDVLIFRDGETNPCVIIPFDDLPINGGRCMGVNIQIRPSPKSYYATIALTVDEKDEMEILRGEVETKTLPQDDWAVLLLQAMYAMLCDLGLIQFSYAKRLSPKHFIMECPHCSGDNDTEGRQRLYWKVKCTHCKRVFIAKREEVRKTPMDYFT